MSGDPLRDPIGAAAAWRGRQDYTQQPLASSANRRETGRPPGVASASTMFSWFGGAIMKPVRSEIFVVKILRTGVAKVIPK
jgi:hypothetical protein